MNFFRSIRGKGRLFHMAFVSCGTIFCISSVALFDSKQLIQHRITNRESTLFNRKDAKDDA
jgi:hypothetical protein